MENSAALDPKYQDEKRKNKEARRREIKDKRKNRLTEKSHQQTLSKGGVKAQELNP
jgi:hypothetical protein